MTLVSISPGGRGGRPFFRPVLESLEDRSVPASLISSVPGTSTGANDTNVGTATTVILGTSSDGQELLIQSTANNLVTNQVSNPGQTNLFWFNRSTGQRYLISAFDPPAGSAVPRETQGEGVVPSTPGVQLNAVISADGQSVAFVSVANAGLFNNSLGQTADGGGDDVFEWSATTQTVTLISKDTRGIALGSYSTVGNPAISADGTVVGFVSDATAAFVTGNAAYLTNSGTVPGGATNGPTIYLVTSGGTPVPRSFENQVDATGKATGDFLVHTNMEVDPLGRWMNSTGTVIIAIRTDMYPQASTTTNPVPSDEVWRYALSTAAGGAFSYSWQPFLLTVTGNQPGVAGLGTVGDAIVVADSSSAALVTYKENATIPTGATGESPDVVAGYVNNNGGDYDLYYVQLDSTATNGLSVQLVTALTGTTDEGQNGTLDSNPGAFEVTPDGSKVVFSSTSTGLVAGLTDVNRVADVFLWTPSSTNGVTTTPAVTTAISVTASDPTRTGNGASTMPVITSDGEVVAFQSTASNLGTIPDGNAVSDVYVRDLLKSYTALASAATGNDAAGNAASTNPVVAGGYQGGYVFFDSPSTNLDSTATVTTGVTEVYATQTPIVVNTAPREIAFSGGTDGYAGLGHFDTSGNLITDLQVQPFPGFTGELRVATADINGDGVPDLIVGAGPGGGPRIIVYDGSNGHVLEDFFAFDSTFTGGVYVATGDFNAGGGGTPSIIIGAGEGGGPRVLVVNGLTGAVQLNAFAFEATARTGVRVAAGDYNGDGIDDLIVSAGVGGGPRVRVFNGATLKSLNVLADFFAYDPSLRGGVNISAGDFNGDGLADIIVGSGAGGAPRVTIFNAASPNPNQPTTLLDFFAFNSNTLDGARPMFVNIEGNAQPDIVVGTGNEFPEIAAFSGAVSGGPSAPLLLKQTIPFNETFGTWGAWVG
ncbi:beta strand repeat-containing protein [Fimbriiglobus ruber]|uniref:Uncharacterized protein n=1 Tax=Fimbriiglobus ruber TaxID=1908690 RepID=A0A225D3K7_9BACT|nr:VCBS repeat-containing protein [Fimbriiglobus ruber]OWK36092.1 hypothetical protein FRUB_08655 [Fimbriiglobus ruber]